jgi:hypothetical protein
MWESAPGISKLERFLLKNCFPTQNAQGFNTKEMKQQD